MQHPTTAQPPHRHWTTHLAALLLAWAMAAAWGSVVQTQFNLQALVGLGVPVPTALRAETTWRDLIGFGPVYAGILAAGWLPALGTAAWLARRWPAWRSPLFATAAGLGMIAAVRAVDAVAPMPVFIDATRSLAGLLTMAAGAVLSGWVCARLTRRVG